MGRPCMRLSTSYVWPHRDPGRCQFLVVLLSLVKHVRQPPRLGACVRRGPRPVAALRQSPWSRLGEVTGVSPFGEQVAEDRMRCSPLRPLFLLSPDDGYNSWEPGMRSIL
jgi:hypothetical protein